MIKIFYKIWVDAIIYEQTTFKKRNLKFYTLIPITVAQGVNLFTLLIWLSYFFDINFDYLIKIDLFPGNKLDHALSSGLTYWLPIIIINYFLIFWKDRYKYLIKKYEYKNGRLYKFYLFFSVGIFIIPVIGLMLLN